jgi:hypothetical protein
MARSWLPIFRWTSVLRRAEVPRCMAPVSAAFGFGLIGLPDFIALFTAPPGQFPEIAAPWPLVTVLTPCDTSSSNPDGTFFLAWR